MVTLGMLWLPIVVSAVVMFFASFVLWMMIGHHANDWRKLPDEDGVRELLRKLKAAPGLYMFPHCGDKKDMKDPAFLKKFEEGPVGILTLQKPGPPSMNVPLLLSFIYNLGIAVVVAYLTGRTRAAGSEYLEVFRVAGTATFLAYGGALFYPAIWMGRPWSVVLKDLVDALVYALLTAGVFGWLWPR